MFKYRRYISAILVVIFKFKFKFKFKSSYQVCIAVGCQPSFKVAGVSAQGLVNWSQFHRRIGVVLVGSCSVSAQSQPSYSVSVGELARSLSLYSHVYRREILLLSSACSCHVQSRRRIGTRSCSLYSSIMLATGLFLINIVHQSLYGSVLIRVVYCSQCLSLNRGRFLEHIQLSFS